MSLDHALALASAAGEGVVRFYQWNPPTISFGRNETTEGVFDRRRAAHEGIAFVRRPTGGRAVFHDDELTYAVACPVRALGGLRAAYHSINQGLQNGLRLLGVPVTLAEAPPRELPPDAGPCFRDPAGGEVVVAGRKLVGSAQTRIGSALLQHGSILLAGDQAAIDRLAVGPRGDDATGATTLCEVLDARPSIDDLVASLTEGLRSVLGGEWVRGATSNDEFQLADEHAEQYRSEAWTWRR